MATRQATDARARGTEALRNAVDDDGLPGGREYLEHAHVPRALEHDLVAGIRDRHHGEQQGLAPTGRHQQLVALELNPYLCVILLPGGDRLGDPLRRGVRQEMTVVAANALAQCLGYGEIGLTDIQVVDADAFGPGTVGQRSEFSTGGGQRFLSGWGSA